MDFGRRTAQAIILLINESHSETSVSSFAACWSDDASFVVLFLQVSVILHSAKKQLRPMDILMFSSLQINQIITFCPPQINVHLTQTRDKAIDFIRMFHSYPLTGLQIESITYAFVSLRTNWLIRCVCRLYACNVLPHFIRSLSRSASVHFDAIIHRVIMIISKLVWPNRKTIGERVLERLIRIFEMKWSAGDHSYCLLYYITT